MARVSRHSAQDVHGLSGETGPRDGVVGSGNQSLPRHFIHLLRSVKPINDPTPADPSLLSTYLILCKSRT